MRDILQVATNGMIAGSIVALLAVSYSLIYSVLRFINFVFGEVLMLAAYAFFAVKTEIGFPTLLAGAAAVVLLGFVGAVVQIGAYRPFYTRSRLACLITALGVSVVLQNAALLAFEGRPLTVSSQLAISVIHLGPVAVTDAQVAVLLAAFGLLILTDLVVFRSAAGLRLRALADNLAMAELLGVQVNRSIATVFLLGSALAATSGVFLALEHLLKPTMGISPGIQAFAACVVGGIGSVRGAVVAAFLISVVGHFVSFASPLFTPETTSYAALLVALVFFPEGLSALFSDARGKGLRATATERESEAKAGTGKRP